MTYHDGHRRFRLVDESDHVLESYDTREQVERRMALLEDTYLVDVEESL